MAGIDNNTVLYLRGDSLKDLSPNNIPIVNQGTTIVDNSINLDSGYFTCNTGFNDVNTTKYWTIEWYEYSTGSSSQCGFICNKPFTSNDGGGILIGYQGISLYIGNATSSWNIFNSVNVKDKVLNVWVHWAFVRNGDSFVMYKNGVKYWEGTSSLFPYAWDDNGFGVGMWYASGGFRSGYKANIKSFRISNIARYTEDFTPPTQPYNSITIETLSQTATNVNFSVTKLGQETINKVEVLVNSAVSKVYTDNYDSINYLIDTDLITIGNNNITIRVTFDDTYTEELSLTHNVTIDKLPTSSNLIQVFDRQEVLNNSLKLHLDNFRNVLTSKNVEVSEEDKMGDLIGKVDLLDAFPPPLYLYKDGDECVDVTGGWGLDIKNGTASFEFLDDKILVKANGNNSHIYVATKSKINLVGYSSLYICCDNITTQENSAFSLRLKNSYGYTQEVAKVEYSGNFLNKIFKMDVSSLNSSYYVSVLYGNTMVSSADVTGNIYKIWLEK